MCLWRGKNTGAGVRYKRKTQRSDRSGKPRAFTGLHRSRDPTKPGTHLPVSKQDRKASIHTGTPVAVKWTRWTGLWRTGAVSRTMSSSVANHNAGPAQGRALLHDPQRCTEGVREDSSAPPCWLATHTTALHVAGASWSMVTRVFFVITCRDMDGVQGLVQPLSGPSPSRVVPQSVGATSGSGGILLGSPRDRKTLWMANGVISAFTRTRSSSATNQDLNRTSTQSNVETSGVGRCQDPRRGEGHPS